MTKLAQVFNQITLPKIPKIPKSLMAITLPIVLQATVLRRRGGYTYRRFVSILCLAITTFVGSGIILMLTLLKKDRESCKYVFRFHSKLVKNLLDLNAIVEGRENMLEPDQPAIYICNHQTMLDAHFMSFSAPKQASVIAKKSLKYYPFFGQFLMLFKCIFIDRSNHENAVIQARQAADEILRKKTSIYAFPEGTRSGVQNVDLLPFKKGLFHMATQAKVPIVPIVIGNYKHIYNPEKKHLGHGSVKIRVLPPVPTKNISEDAESVAELIDDVRSQMLAALKEISIPVNAGKDLIRAKI